MQKCHPPFTISHTADAVRSSLPSSEIPRLIDSWLVACDIERHSQRTIDSRRERVSRLSWFLNQKGLKACSLSEIRAFFSYLNHGHKDRGVDGGTLQIPVARNPSPQGVSSPISLASVRSLICW